LYFRLLGCWKFYNNNINKWIKKFYTKLLYLFLTGHHVIVVCRFATGRSSSASYHTWPKYMSVAKYYLQYTWGITTDSWLHLWCYLRNRSSPEKNVDRPESYDSNSAKSCVFIAHEIYIYFIIFSLNMSRKTASLTFVN
jgi:hypothetical protein